MALDGITLRVHPDEWVGLLGLNGACKTTLVRAIAGRVRLDRGPQENALYPFMTARENLEVFGGPHGLQGGFWPRCFVLSIFVLT